MLECSNDAIPPLIDWVSHGITNWIYPDPDPFVSHAKIQGAIFSENKNTALNTQVRSVGLPEIQGFIFQEKHSLEHASQTCEASTNPGVVYLEKKP